MAKITSEQECLLNEIEEADAAFRRDGKLLNEIEQAVAAFRRDGKLLWRPRKLSGDLPSWLVTDNPSFDFRRREYKPVPKPEFKWPEGLNVASMRINEGLWLELCFHGSPTIAVPLNTLKGDIIKSMEVDKVYRNPLGQEPPVKPQLQH